MEALTQGKPSHDSSAIKINAPGSGTLTSDIDTSVAVRIERNAKALLEHAGKSIQSTERGLNCLGRIRNAVIHNFYSLSEKRFQGMTSGKHRDSNVYVELPDTEDYPKFKLDVDNNLRSC